MFGPEITALEQENATRAEEYARILITEATRERSYNEALMSSLNMNEATLELRSLQRQERALV